MAVSVVTVNADIEHANIAMEHTALAAAILKCQALVTNELVLIVGISTVLGERGEVFSVHEMVTLRAMWAQIIHAIITMVNTALCSIES